MQCSFRFYNLHILKFCEVSEEKIWQGSQVVKTDRAAEKRATVSKNLMFSHLHPCTHRTQILVWVPWFGCPSVTAATELLNIRQKLPHGREEQTECEQNSKTEDEDRMRAA